VLDECHERHLDTDLALAFGVDVRAACARPAAARHVGDGAGRAGRGGARRRAGRRGAGALHPVEPVWCPPAPPVAPRTACGSTPRLLDHVAAVVRRAHAETAGDLLVFLPGAGGGRAVAGRLRDALDADVVPLHGRLSPAAQDDALRQREGRRVVLATSVAESSLTVPGVRVVVDAGLARVPRTDLARGLGSLVTVPVSRASAQQRAGRAGREAPGRVYRCWSPADHDRLPAHEQPALATADLTAFALELACWGTPGGRGLALLDPPPPASMEVAVSVLRDLGAVDERGAATGRGRTLTAVGAHPRLARALLDGAPLVGARRAAEVVALLTDDGVGVRGDDLAAALRDLRSGRDPAASARWRDEVRRLERTVPPAEPTGVPADLAAGVVVGLAFPERLARQRAGASGTYLMSGGTGAELAPGTALAGAAWLAVAVADRPPGRRDARIRLAVVVDEATVTEVGATLRRTGTEVVWQDGDVRAREVDRLGAVVLRERVVTPDVADAAAAVQEGLRQEGLALLRWTPAARSLRQRLAACRAGLGDPWPDVGDEALLGALDLSGARSRRDLERLDVGGGPPSPRALVGRGPPRRARAGARPGRERLAGPRRLRRPDRSVAARQGAGGLRLGRRSGRRGASAATAPALARRPGRRRHQRPGVVLDDRVPGRAGGPAGPLPAARLARGPGDRGARPTSAATDADAAHARGGGHWSTCSVCGWTTGSCSAAATPSRSVTSCAGRSSSGPAPRSSPTAEVVVGRWCGSRTPRTTTWARRRTPRRPRGASDGCGP
jgi:ATP-dependent helicase HrpB